MRPYKPYTSPTKKGAINTPESNRSAPTTVGTASGVRLFQRAADAVADPVTNTRRGLNPPPDALRPADPDLNILCALPCPVTGSPPLRLGARRPVVRMLNTTLTLAKDKGVQQLRETAETTRDPAATARNVGKLCYVLNHDIDHAHVHENLLPSHTEGDVIVKISSIEWRKMHEIGCTATRTR